MTKSTDNVTITVKDSLLAYAVAANAGNKSIDKGHNAIEGAWVRLTKALPKGITLGEFDTAYKQVKVVMQSSAKWGGKPSAKSPGSFAMPKYMTQCASRIRGALRNGIDPSEGSQKSVREAIQKAEGEKATAANRKLDPLFDERMRVAQALADLSKAVRDGSHDKAVLDNVAEIIETVTKTITI